MSEPKVRVGVVLVAPAEDFGGWLADAAAFDAAGADALWLDLPADELDPLAVAAALATLTFRSLLVTPLPPYATARTLATVSRLSRGRLALCGDREALAKVARAGGPRPEIFARFGDGFVSSTAEERWERTVSPDGRAAWREALTGAAGRGVGGLLVPAGPRLLDILRNPGDIDDRRDLQLAQG
jgi:hypothetical protein